MKEHIPLMTGGTPEMAEMWVKICLDGQKAHDTWIEDLRRQGYKAAHPNDGWVDREKLIISFVYPQFDDDAQVGDKMILGGPPNPNWTEDNYPIELLEEAKWFLDDTTKRFKFRYLGEKIVLGKL